MDRIAFSIFGKDIYWYGIIIALALILGVFIGVKEARRRGYKAEMILDFMLIAIPVCIICARLYYVIFEWSLYSGNLLKIFAVWEGGLAIYGAVIGGVISAIIFFQWRRVPVGDILDIAAPGIIIGQAIGRWGNFVNQEAHGQQILNPQWQWFPAGVHIGGAWFQATFFYESAWNFIVFIVLMLLRKKIKARGGLFALYVTLYGFGRFWIEQLRTDSLMWNGIRVSQGLSELLFIGGILYLFIMSRRQKEHLAYDGIYSVSWTDAQVSEYKANSKKFRAQEKAQRAEMRVEALRGEHTAANSLVRRADADAARAAAVLQQLRAKYGAENDRAAAARKEADKAEAAAKKLLAQYDEQNAKVKAAQSNAKKAGEKAEALEKRAGEQDITPQQQAQLKKAEQKAESAAKLAKELRERYKGRDIQLIKAREEAEKELHLAEKEAAQLHSDAGDTEAVQEKVQQTKERLEQICEQIKLSEESAELFREAKIKKAEEKAKMAREKADSIPMRTPSPKDDKTNADKKRGK